MSTSSNHQYNRNQWCLTMSDAAARTTNPIRAIVDGMKVTPNPNKSLISLALGDPTVYGNFSIHTSCINTIIKHLQNGQANGYPPAHGSLIAREAVAKFFSLPNNPSLTADDVILASGCSGALDLCITAIANPGQTILLPRPGFSVYQTIADSKGILCKYYDLDPNNNWEIDLNHLESLIDNTTALILINNPSNPCGSNYSYTHLQSILNLAEKYYLPIIADEIYGHMTFNNHLFIPLASIPSSVPVLSVGGLAKRWLVPGWRIGWILIYDRPNNPTLQSIRIALHKLSQIIIGCNSLIQAALPDIFLHTPQQFYIDTNQQLENHSQLVVKLLSNVPGLHVCIPQGAMYMMIGILIDQFIDISNDIIFTERLLTEESVMTLPGMCFQFPNYFRIVTCPTEDKLIEACHRITEFCARHHV